MLPEGLGRESSGQGSSPPKCMRCIHYRVSWDPSLPHVCEAFEIKSRLMPSVEILKTVGSNCPAFRAKEAPRP